MIRIGHQSGMTRIELLVVIAIIVALIVLLMPPVMTVPRTTSAIERGDLVTVKEYVKNGEAKPKCFPIYLNDAIRFG